LAGRYVDDKGQPLADPAQQPFNEFRMMPITLKVIIEQKEIPRFLAECANSAMRIDVRRVRILVQPVPPLDGGAADSSGAAAGGARPTPVGRTGQGTGGGRGGAANSEGSGDSTYDEEAADPVFPPVPVEVHGIIYIYNPPVAKNPGEKAGENGNPTAPNTALPANGAAGTGMPAALAPAANANPAGAIPPTAPATSGLPVNPPKNKPVPGGRP
jgi:hypothetical protein